MPNMREIPDIPIGIEPIKSGPLQGGGSWLYRFDNNHGASVICHQYSYGGTEGLYELLVARFDGPSPTWTHPTAGMIESIMESVPELDDHGLAGWLTDIDVARILGVIRGWEPANKQPSAFRDTTYYVSDNGWKGTATDSW